MNKLEKTLAVVGIVITVVVAFGASYMEIKITRAHEKQDRMDLRLNLTEKSTMLNKENINDNQRLIYRVETNISGFQNKFIRLDEKVNLLSNNYVSNQTFSIRMDKLEAQLKGDIKRLGNVMFNDRAQLVHKIDINTQYINFLRGHLGLDGVSPRHMSKVAPHINLDK